MKPMERLAIRGKFNTATCYINDISDDAVKQIRRLCDCKASQGTKIRIMPDVHVGNGCAIGTTMTFEDKIIPNLVGSDIGCGIYAVKLGSIDIDFEKLDWWITSIPTGQREWMDWWPINRFSFRFLKCYPKLKKTMKLEREIGTLGNKNHFIEIDEASDGTKYLVIHSGSRNLGNQVARIYQNLAVDCCRGLDDISRLRKNLVRDYHESGKDKEIQLALQELDNIYRTAKPDIPKDLCYLQGEYLLDYFHDVEICQRFAQTSREIIAEILMRFMKWEKMEGFHTIHNYIDMENKILRKGAISANKGEKVLIPVNMRDGCILAIGKGNPEWNYSAPHGAGRLMSRTHAKAVLNMEDFKKLTMNLHSPAINEKNLDESPMVYRSLEAVVNSIKDTVDIVDIMKPICNYKPTEEYLALG